MKKQLTQEQHFWKAHDRIAAQNNHFMELVRNNDITADELEKLIALRPEAWGRFKGWVSKLPRVNQEPAAMAALKEPR